MAEHGDDASNCSSSFQKTVVLRDWWLIKCSKEFNGKRFGVAGTEESVETRAMRVFTSSPIVKALDVFTLQASDGICITLRGFLNKEHVVSCGFLPEISREFIFGFPPSWERICNNCFGGVSSIIDKACSPILSPSPCKYSKGNLADYPAESRDKSTVAETNTAEINNKDGSRGRDKNNARRKSLHLQSKSRRESAEEERKLESSKVKNTTNDGDHVSEGLDKGRNGDVEKDEYEAINIEDNEWRLDESNVQNHANDESYGGEGLDKAKSSDVEKVECEAICNEIISPADGCGRNHSGADNADEVTSTSATGESMTSEQSRGELKVTRASPHALFEDLDKSTKPGKKGSSKKSGKTLKSHGNVVEPVNHSGTKVENAKKKTKLDASKVQKPTTNDGDHGSEGLNERHVGTDSVDKLQTKKATKKSLNSEQRKGRVKVPKTSLHSLSEDLNNSSKSGKKSKSKKSERNVVEPMNNSGSEAKEDEDNLSWGKTKRKIDFDEEVTPDKEVKKQKTSSASTDSLGQKRSRSGRILVSSLEFWRNQLPVYDKDRNLIQVKEGTHEANSSTPSNGKRSDSRKPRR